MRISLQSSLIIKLKQQKNSASLKMTRNHVIFRRYYYHPNAPRPEMSRKLQLKSEVSNSDSRVGRICRCLSWTRTSI